MTVKGNSGPSEAAWEHAAKTVIKDSGERQEFSTGSVRDSEKGKGLYAHLSPIALKRLAQHMEAGAEKYNFRNWELGQPLARYLESAIRHLYTYLEGSRDEDHLAAAMWNVHGIIHTEEMIKRGVLPKELDNLPHYYPSRAKDFARAKERKVKEAP